MKKLLLGFFAMAVAIVSVALTSSEKPYWVDIFFQYNGPNYTEGEVEKPSNWIETSSLNGCDDVDEKACRIKVDHTDTDGTSPNRTLKAGTLIIAAPFGTAPNITYYVTVGGDVLAKSNDAQTGFE